MKIPKVFQRDLINYLKYLGGAQTTRKAWSTMFRCIFGGQAILGAKNEGKMKQFGKRFGGAAHLDGVKNAC